MVDLKMVGAVSGGVATIIAGATLMDSIRWRHVQQRKQSQLEAKQERLALRQEEMAKDARLAALLQPYYEDIAPAAAVLDGLKTQHPGGKLWTAVQKPLQPEQQARNSVKGFWLRLATALENGELPAHFGHAIRQPDGLGAIELSDATWHMRADNFRQLCEPFDIANYYRLGLDHGSGHYIETDNRPYIYSRIEAMRCGRLRAEANSAPVSSQPTYMDSLVWAYVLAKSVPAGWPLLAPDPAQLPPVRRAVVPPP